MTTCFLAWALALLFLPVLVLLWATESPPHPYRPLASSGDDVEGDLESAGRIGVDRQEVGRRLRVD